MAPPHRGNGGRGPHRRLRWLFLTVVTATALAYSCRASLRTPAAAPETPHPATWSSSDLNVSYLGHASILIGFGKVRILTDPTFHERIGLSLGPWTLGPKRLVQVALPSDGLPRLDAVLVTHAHMDSLDHRSLRSIANTPLIVVPPRTADLVSPLGFERVVELGWGERISVGDVTIEAVRVKHWGKRWPLGRWRGYNGYLLSRGPVSVLFASDTAYTDSFRELAEKHRITAAVIGNGAYDPWVWNHATPEEVWRMFQESGARYLLPVHWDTFRLGKEPLGEAMSRLLTAAGADADRVVIRRIGETWTMKIPDGET